jgi:hypothetical protein
MAVIRMMRLLGIPFATFCVLAATAAAGGIDEHSPSHARGRGGVCPATAGTGVADAAGPSGARRTPDPDARNMAHRSHKIGSSWRPAIAA